MADKLAVLGAVALHESSRYKLFSVLERSCMFCCRSDVSVMTEMRMSDLMEMKSYTKLIAKQSKEFESLRRKHEKVVNIVHPLRLTLYYRQDCVK